MKASFWKIAVSLCALAALWFVSSAPAMAQASNPSGSQYSQYVDCSGAEEGVQACQGAIEVYGGIEAAVENAGRGTEALNNALGGSLSSSSENADDAGNKNKGTGTGEVSTSITELPKTGGASPAALVLGVFLVALGLATRKAG